MRRLRAFTLVELLVVLAIIAVLTGIILAVLPAARKRSYEAECLSNLRQLGQAFAMYKQDWGGIEAEPGRYYEPWQLGLPPKISVRTMEGGFDVVIGRPELWRCRLDPYQNGPVMTSTSYYVNFTACFEPYRIDPPNVEPGGACRLWREAVFRLGQKAWLVGDPHHWEECARIRRGHCPYIFLNLNFEVRRFMASWNATSEEIDFREH